MNEKLARQFEYEHTNKSVYITIAELYEYFASSLENY